MNTSIIRIDDSLEASLLIDDRGTNNYKLLLDALSVLLLRDRNFLVYVFPYELQSLVLAKVIELPLKHMHKEAQHLCEAIERLPRKLDYGKFSVYGLFSIVRWCLKSRHTLFEFFQVNSFSFFSIELKRFDIR